MPAFALCITIYIVQNIITSTSSNGNYLESTNWFKYSITLSQIAHCQYASYSTHAQKFVNDTFVEGDKTEKFSFHLQKFLAIMVHVYIQTIAKVLVSVWSWHFTH